ncbi:hypothetical protein fugu_017487 [Takifugu bimaculatus]|uniref:Uncharacterized protein n=1 Tax=Takifugu bimaculatus TaxID=433685 RepID=A0A4Z2BSL8_9TELE|nr:hypothetical protein fugu_017487 [Takifugu bimaculatus]
MGGLENGSLNRCALWVQEGDSGGLPGPGAEAAAGSHQTLRVTAVTRPRGRAAGQSGQFWAVLAARSLRVLVVSFGSLEGAQIWLEQTGCAFDIVLDPQRTIYRTFGLSSSYADVLRFDCLLQYSEYEAEGRSFPDVPSRLLEDIYQMGGDFLLDEAGTVLFSHRCRTPLDRPSVQDVLQAADVRV